MTSPTVRAEGEVRQSAKIVTSMEGRSSGERIGRSRYGDGLTLINVNCEREIGECNS